MAVVGAVIAVVSLGLNALMVLVVGLHRDQERWRRDRLEEHVLEVLRVGRDLRYEMNNLQPVVRTGSGQIAEELWRSPPYLAQARPEQQRQLDRFLELSPKLPRLADAISLLGSPRMDEAAWRLAGAMGSFGQHLSAAARAIDPRSVAFGPEYARLLQAWIDTEHSFSEVARLELGVGPSLQSRLLTWLQEATGRLQVWLRQARWRIWGWLRQASCGRPHSAGDERGRL